MKKMLLFFAGVLLAVVNSTAQINISNTTYTSSQIRTDSFKATMAATTYPSFAPAINATWDLSTITDSAGYTIIYRVTAAPATFADSSFFSLGTNAYQGNVLSAIAASGYTQSGIKIQNATYPIGTTAGDTIFILLQNTIFTTPGTVTASPRNVIKLPATMSSSWTSSYESDFNYQVSYVPGYVHAPGVVKSYYSEKDSVIGWGKMRVKTGAGPVSGYMSVLQVRTQITRTDTFYLNGGITDPGLPTLLGVLGFAQGQTTKSYAQNFYRLDEVSPLAFVTFSDSANTIPTKITTHKQRLLPTAVPNVLNEANVTIYPNPLAGRSLSIEVPVATGEWKYELVNMAGQVVAADMLQLGSNKTHTQIQIAATVNAGIYFIRLINDGKQVVVKPLEIN